MAIEFRKTVDEDELVEAFRMMMVAFGEEVEERDVERARKTMPVDRVHVAVDGGKFVGVTAAHEFSLTIPGGELPAAGVTWVAVLPTHRRQGVATGLMRHQFDDFRERDTRLVMIRREVGVSDLDDPHPTSLRSRARNRHDRPKKRVRSR